jgi:DNA-binding MarR family transcriptional regulator
MTRTKRIERTAEGAAISELILAIFRANGRLIRAGDVLTRDLGLTSARWQVLGAIAPAPKTVAQIAREFELTRQGVLWVVQSMIGDGFVELINNPDHRRA